MTSTPIYGLRVADVFRDLETCPDGLSSGEVEARQELYGPNLITEQRQTQLLRELIKYTIHPMALLLWAAGVMAFIGGGPGLGIAIWVLVLVNAGFSFWREHRAEQAMAALHRLLPAYARLIRAGVEVKIPASEVVPGDVLILAEGDNIPADVRVVEEYGLRTNNSTLTGEAVPARKTSDASLREGISELERPNLAFAGTSIVSGTGRGVAYATGMLTQFGRIARLTQTVKEQPSPLQIELARITRIISLVAIGLGSIVGLVTAFDPALKEILKAHDPILLAIGIIAAAVPEGLPATVTLSLAMAAQRLAHRGVLVKKLSMAETLGTVSVICTDKSGTLTQNQMTVRQVWVAGERLTISGVGYEPIGSFSPDPGGKPFEKDLRSFLMAALLCNNARLNPPTPEHPQWACIGDQTEAALKVMAFKMGLDDDEINRVYVRLHELPFDARRKRMSTIHRWIIHEPENSSNPPLTNAREIQSASTGQHTGIYELETTSNIVFVKGAPREIVQLCSHILIHGQVTPLDAVLRAEILAENDDYSRNALRVLALARRELPSRSGAYTIEKVETDLTFLGLAAMMDPPRPEVSKAMKVFQTAGIRMVMITGDYGLTAESLARRVGMIKTNNTVIITGAELDDLDDTQLQSILEKEVLFARMAPEHKLRLVGAFQARGEVVAVTGDGVNDAPALRKADVGVAMGIIGTDVAKEAADVILVNDDFSALVNAIEEGRAVYDNLRKFITYIFSSNVPEILPFLMTAMFHIPLALGVAQILAIDLGTDLFPALALGTEKPEADIMNRPPRRRARRLIDGGLLSRSFLWLGLIEAVLCFLAYFFVYDQVGGINFLQLTTQEWANLPDILAEIPLSVHYLAVTVFFAGVVVTQIGNAFACRTEKSHVHDLGWISNRGLLGGIAIEVILIILLIYFPPIALSIFGQVPIPLMYWIGLSWFGFILYLLEWFRKAFLRQLDKWRESDRLKEA